MELKILPLNIKKLSSTQRQNCMPKSPAQNDTSTHQSLDIKIGYYLPINFKANEDRVFRRELLSLEDIHCPFCGTKMLTAKSLSDKTYEGSKIKSPKEFAKWLEENIEYMQPVYRDIVKYAKQFSNVKQIDTMDKLLDIMQEQAIQDRQNGVAKINQIIEETKQNHEFSESDKMLMEECQVELENYQYNNKLSFNITTHNILKQTISNLESEEKYKLYGKIQYESKKTGLLEKILYFDKNVTKNTRQEELLHKLFSHSYSVIIATNPNQQNKTEFAKQDIMLSCRDCQDKKQDIYILKFHNIKPNSYELLGEHISDLSEKILNGTLKDADDYPLKLMGNISNATRRKLSLKFNYSSKIREIYANDFQKTRKENDFPLVNHSGIPCATCGVETFSHEDKLKKFADIEQLKTNQDYVDYLKTNKKHITPNFKPIVLEIITYLEKNPTASENQTIENLRRKLTENLKNTLKYNIKLCKEKSTMLNENDQKLLQIYVDTVENSLIPSTTHKRPFLHKDYNNILFKTLFKMENRDFHRSPVTEVKENIRTAANRQTLLYPRAETIKKVGSPLKVIIEDIIKNAVATTDHAIAKNKEGQNHIANYVLMCKSCNSEKTDYSFKHWYDLHPEIKINLQKNIDKVVEMIKTGVLKDFMDYPPQIAHQIKKLTNGEIILKFDLNTLRNKTTQNKKTKKQ